MAKITFNNKRNFTTETFRGEELDQIITAENINEIKSVVNDNETTLANLKTYAESQANDHNERLNSLNGSINSLTTKTNEINTLKQTITTLTDRIQSLENRNNSSSNRPTLSIRYQRIITDREVSFQTYDLRTSNNGGNYMINFSAPSLSTGESIDYYLIAVTPQIKERSDFGGYSKNATARFIFEPIERNNSSQIFNDTPETQCIAVVNATDRDHTITNILINPESGGFMLKASTNTIYNGTAIPNFTMRFKVSVTAKIRRIT
ncbi:YhgE/Pip domain-containing protein [Mesomycoplasma molare]|uniref:Uncharacterized protein n=1 Tax=Mesomycoplasma molare TaxID=171288 RepID=A0ABY5TUN3_9BACT|nr:hypothetical protein [Mesomycoplasma molare]UWD34049.1 hypothetical protein NX772_03000 [Mesomycoplasma molare]